MISKCTDILWIAGQDHWCAAGRCEGDDNRIRRCDSSGSAGRTPKSRRLPCQEFGYVADLTGSQQAICSEVASMITC
jgi:hypothetical protein